MSSPRKYVLNRVNLDKQVRDQVFVGDLIIEEERTRKKLYGSVESVRDTEFLIRTIRGGLLYKELDSEWLNNHFFISLQRQAVLVKYGTDTWIDLSWCDARKEIPFKDLDVLIMN